MSRQTVAVVVEQRDAAAGRFENVVLGRAAAIDLRGRRAPSSNVTGDWRAVVGRRRVGGAGPIADACPPYAGSLGFVWL